MALKWKSTNDLLLILGAKGGLRFDATTYNTDDLMRLAHEAKSGGGRLILRGISDRKIDDLMRIAAAGGGQVIFED